MGYGLIATSLINLFPARIHWGISDLPMISFHAFTVM
jgi:hypothetical protein